MEANVDILLGGAMLLRDGTRGHVTVRWHSVPCYSEMASVPCYCEMAIQGFVNINGVVLFNLETDY